MQLEKYQRQTKYTECTRERSMESIYSKNKKNLKELTRCNKMVNIKMSILEKMKCGV